MTGDPGADEPARRRPAAPDPEELALAHAHAESGDDRPDDLDEHGRRVLAALDRTRADLTRHGDDLVREHPTMPPSLLAGIDRALAAERSAPPSPSPAAASRRWTTRPAVLLAAAVLLIALAVGGVLARSAPTGAAPPPRAGDVTTGPPAGRETLPLLAAPDVDGGRALWAGLGGRAGTGPSGDPARWAGCLAAHGVPAGIPPAGVRDVVYEGRPAVLFVLTTGVAARFRILVVEPGCAVGRPLTLADRDVGR